MNVLIVDDEPLARSRLQRLLSQFTQITRIRCAEHAARAWELIQQQPPELILLDIDMPEEDGLTFAARVSSLCPPPAIVFVTAHSQHALAAYQVAAADYLVKPVAVERLAAMLNKVGMPTLAHLERQSAGEPKIAYQSGGLSKVVTLSQVYYFCADTKYVKMVFQSGEAYLDSSLNELELRYPQLLRVHRSYLLNMRYFAALKQQSGGHYHIQLNVAAPMLPVSRRALAHVKHALQLS